MIPLAAINPHSTFFLLYALIACGFAVAVLATSNIVRMAFYLTLSLGATSGLFFLAGAEFVGAMQLLIYVGGTLVLLIFGVMLTAQSRFISMQTAAGDWILGGIVGAVFLAILLRVAFSVEAWKDPLSDSQQAAVAMIDSKTTTPIGLALTGVRADKLDETNAILRRGMSGYLLPFVIISMHLLVVLIGAGYMARTRRRGSGIGVPSALSAAQRAARQSRRMGFLIKVGLIKGMVINFLLAVLCFALWLEPATAAPSEGAGALASGWHWLSSAVATSPDWLLPALGITFVLNLLLLVVVYNWQSWAVLGLIAIPMAQAAALANANLNIAVGDMAVAIAYLILALGPVIVLILLMTSGKQPTVWSQME